jgi:hypothetical protein
MKEMEQHAAQKGSDKGCGSTTFIGSEDIDLSVGACLMCVKREVQREKKGTPERKYIQR